MKTLPTLAAVAIAMALVLSPMVVNAAGSITFTSPASGASYTNSQTYTISGTISPAPTQADQVGLTVKNPTGQTVDLASVTVSSGSFSYSTAVGGTAAWVTGTYTITALDSYGATGTATFSYTSTTGSGYNVTKALINIQGNQSIILAQLATLQKDLKGNFTAQATSESSEATALTAIQNSLGTLSSAVSQLQSSLTSIGTQVGTINSNVQSLGSQITTAANNAQSAANAVSSTQTYVLVVAVLAAITLVLELAILVRKIS
ncbi:MAG: hypothetical protein KGI26_05110 [Thaumarchaeota archaeon]|nr:hypothetical protein [Nitrososphaerota archaeon]